MIWVKIIYVCNRVWDNFRGIKCKLIYIVGIRMLNVVRFSVNESLIIIVIRLEVVFFKLFYSVVELIYWFYLRKKYFYRFCV